MFEAVIDREDIEKAKLKLGDTEFELIMEALGITDYDPKGKKCLCPYHTERTPSCVFNPKTGSMHCFGCGKTFDLIDVLIEKGSSYSDAVKKLFEAASMDYLAASIIPSKPKSDYRYPKPVECHDKSQVYEYLSKRGISKETADYLDIREDSKGNCVFNYYSNDGTELLMVKYRPSHKVVKPNPKNWCQEGADTTSVLFNISRINPERPLLICSGELDCAAAIEAGWKNAVSIPLGDQNTQWLDTCWDILEQCNEIIVAYDNDDSGRKFIKDIVPRLGSWRTKVTHAPEPNKDLNELLYRSGKEAVFDCIMNATDTPINSIADFSEIEALDFNQLDGVVTGIGPLDDKLTSLPVGTLTILSGMPGSGKSSILAQMIAESMENGTNVWLYSGELANCITKGWISFILGGRRNIEEIDYGSGSFYKVKEEANELINEYYKGRCFIYKDNFDRDIDSLIVSATESIRKYGCKLIILDNLMTVMGDSEDQLREQTEVTKKLIALAQKFNVSVILVAHPRKVAANANIGLYDLFGSSSISNLCSRSLGLRRVTPEEKEGTDMTSTLKAEMRKYDVILTVAKDRMKGRSGEQIGLYFDNVSRRFYWDEKSFDRQYSFDKKEYETRLVPQRLLEDDREVFGERE